MCDLTVADLVRRYRQAAIEHTRSSDLATCDPDGANRAHDQLHHTYKLLRQTHEGRQALVSLMDDPDPGVRMWAAAHSLQWETEKAKAVLQELIQVGGLLGFEAEMTLKEYAKGRLSFDY
jgi:hypothetical protein